MAERRNALHKTLATLLLFASVLTSEAAVAQEARLICKGVIESTTRQKSGTSVNESSGQTEDDYVDIPTKVDVIREIRFDQDKGEFWYKGAGRLISKKGNRDGWIPALTVEFTDDLITATFEPGGMSVFRDIASLGLSKLKKAPNIGELDRYSGIWRIRDMSLTCRLLEAKERKF